MKLFKLLTFITLMLFSASIAADDFTIGNKTFLLNGQPFIVKAAEVHYPRIPRPYWEHRIQMCKALGMNSVCIYIFWNIHEQKKASSTSPTITTWPSSAVWHKRTACMSSYAQAHTFVPNGRWAVCLGGSSRRKTSSCVSATPTSWNA